MRTTAELQDSIGDLQDELDSIVAIAERESRDLTDDENNRILAITDQDIPTLRKQLKTQVKLQDEKLKRSAARFEAEIEAKQTNDLAATQGDRRWRDVKVPAVAKRHAELKAFKGPDGERDAYVAGQVILAGLYRSQSAIDWCDRHSLNVRATMIGGDNIAGGFLVPEEMQSTLIRLREEYGVYPRFANRIPMGSDIITIPRLLTDVTAYWVGEGAEITASDANLGSVELMARKIACLTKVSKELDQDAVVEIGDMIVQSMAYDMAFTIDDSAFNGDGTQASYGGILGLANALNANAIVDAATGNDAANNLDLLDFQNVLGAYPLYPGASPRWYMSRAVFHASAARLEAAAGGNTITTIANGVPEGQFLGYPVTFVQVMPTTTTTLASTIVAYFGDLRLGATYGVRRAMNTEVTLDRYFENDLIGIKATERIAVNIHERGDTIRNRPILALKTAA